MATSRSQEARIKKWEDRIRASNKTYKKWDERFDTSKLEDYYLGRQWYGISEDEAQKKYVINLFFSTIETNKPSLIFQNPQVRMSVKPSIADDLLSGSQERTQLCQDTVQSFIDDPDFAFVDETSLALHEAHFRFGVIEVGYTSDWIDNPNAGRPMLKEKASDESKSADEEDAEETEGEPEIDSDGQPIMHPERLIQSEKLYIKRIPADTFRVSMSSKNRHSQNDWSGYFEWHYVEDIKSNPLYEKGARGLKASGTLLDEYKEDGENEDDRETKNGMVKVWKIWDHRSMTRKVIAEGHKKFLLDGVPYKFSPFAFLRLYPVLNSFYPCPAASQWLGPQDEINETRDAQRAHRRRFYRRYTMLKNAIDPHELEKMETGGDGIIVEANVPNPLTEVPLAPMGGDVWAHLDASKQDFITISGVSDDQRGVAGSETATQANIIDKRTQLREASARAKVQSWLAEISRLMLMTIREDMALPFWIKRNVDMAAIPANQGSEVMRVATIWNEVSAEDLGTSDMEVSIDLSTMSPVAEEQERNAWNQILGLLTNPQLMMVLGMSPALLKKTLRLYGITSQTEIMEIQKVIQQFLMMQVAAQAAAAEEGKPASGGGGPKAAGGSSPPPPPGETPAELNGVTVQ